MAGTTGNSSLKTTLLFGGVSVLLYGFIFTYSTPLTSLFARGGFHCVLPVLTVFLVSYFYAEFAGGFWAALGIRPAAQDDGPRAATRKPHRSAQALRRP